MAEDCTCATNKPNPDTLEQEGEAEYSETWGGKSSETVTPYRCTVCGTRWRHVDESGISRGRFWNRVK